MSPPVVVDEHSKLDKVILLHDMGHSAEIFLHGGHVTSWKVHDGEENLFVSSKAVFKPPKAIRGGIPVCFPQFGPAGPLNQHGFARNRLWKVDPNNTSDNKHSVTLLLTPTEEDKKLWPHKFELRQTISLNDLGDLSTKLSVVNVDSVPFTFTFALHTYFSISDIREVRIEGLEALDYLDNLQGGKKGTDDGESIFFDSEFDRIYLATPPKIVIIDHSKRKTFVIVKENLPDAVVWNPWTEKAKSMSDMGDEDFYHMVCVEAAAINEPVVLKAGEEWLAKQELRIVPSSFHSGILDPEMLKAAAASVPIE